MLPKPYENAIIYEDKKLYVCLANEPIVDGHTVVVWKDKVADLHLLTKKNYEYLMDKVNEIRSAMLKALGIKKVYLLYMDEAKQVHWHLIPSYKTKGFENLTQKPGKIKDFSLDDKIRKCLSIKI
ncbi:MAG: HIT family protein [Candidatus Buchananbacteria bacterium]